MNWLLVIGAAMLGFQVMYAVALAVGYDDPKGAGNCGLITFALIAAWIAWTVNP